MAEEKASKININGQEYEIKDAQARELLDNKVDLSVYEEMIQEKLTLIPINPADVFSLPTGAMFLDSFGYCYKIGKLLLLNCVIGGLHFIAEADGMQTDTGITIKSEYLGKMEHSIIWTAQTLLQKNGAMDVCAAQLDIDGTEGTIGEITMGFPSSVGGAEVNFVMLGGVIPLTKE